MNVLIVDDRAISRELLRAQLQSEGHAVVEAANGIEALELIERDHVDAVISDILMPEMDGFRLCQKIRNSETLGPAAVHPVHEHLRLGRGPTAGPIRRGRRLRYQARCCPDHPQRLARCSTKAP